MLEALAGRGGAYPWRAHILALSPLLLLLAGLRLYFGGSEEMFAGFTRHGERFPLFKAALEQVSDYGNLLCYCVYPALAWRYAKRRDREGGRFLIALAVSALATLAAARFLKFAVGRPRPPAPWDKFGFFAPEPGHDSLPSGHVTESVLLIAPLAARFGEIAQPLLCGLAPAAMGLSRLYLGAHYPGDVLAAAAVGSGGALLAWRLAGPGGGGRIAGAAPNSGGG